MLEVLSFFKTVLGWIGWLGVGVVPVAIAAVLIWLDPKLLKPALAAVGVWLLVFFAWTLGDQHGATRIQDKWQEAVIEEGEHNAAAREESERATPALEPAPVEGPAKSAVCTPATPRARNDGVLRSDPFNRLRERR